MSGKSFGELSELGQARRLKPLAQTALGAYDLEPTGLRLISNAWNCVFRVDTAAGPHVIRITRPVPGADEPSVRSEVEFMAALAAGTDIAVPRVLPDRHGELVTVAAAAGVPEPRTCVVFSWLGGPDLAERRSTSNWTKLGQLMGAMHRFAEGWRPPGWFTAPDYETCIPYGQPLVVFEPGRAELYGLGDVLREAVDVTDKRISTLRRDVASIVLHADLHQWNVKILRGVLSPFDFEDLLTGPPVLDVATSLYYVRYDEDYPDLARAFKAGYERERSWVEREPGELDRVMFARSIDLLNTLLLDDSIVLADEMEAFVRRRELLALVALERRDAVEL